MLGDDLYNIAISIISNVLKEEVIRLKENVSVYEKSLASLPRGSIYIVKVSNSSFVYRKYKENGKVISKYILIKPKNIKE